MDLEMQSWTWDTLVKETSRVSGLVAVLMTTEHCQACKPIKQRLLRGAEQGLWWLFVVDANTSPEIVEQYSIQGVPAILVFSGGALVDYITKPQSMSDLAGHLMSLAPTRKELVSL